jgi:hypothetical protein
MMKDGTRAIAARQLFSVENYRFDNNNCLVWPLAEDPEPRPTIETSDGRKDLTPYLLRLILSSINEKPCFASP